MPRRGHSTPLARAAVLGSDDVADVDVQLGNAIRSLRTARKLSQTALGQRIGVSFQQVQKYERGSNRVSASTLMLIANALEVSAADILRAFEVPAESPDGLPALADPLEHDLLASFRAIASSGRRKAIVGLVAEMANL